MWDGSPLDRLTPMRLVAIGLVLRIIWLVICDNQPMSDQIIYHHGARDIAFGRGFVDEGGRPHGWWPVGYPAALSPFYLVLGDSPRSGYVGNAVFGALLIVGVYRLGRELVGERGARLSAAVAAVHPTFVMLTTVFASENLFVALAVWGSFVLVRAVHVPSRAFWYCVVGGALVGGSAYVRAPGLVLAAVFPVWALLNKRGVVRTALLSGLVAAVAIAVLVPWGVRTQRAFGVFRLVSMNGASNLWMGNNPESTGGYMPLPSRVEHFGVVEREAALKAEALSFIRDNPGTYVALCGKRMLMTLRSDTIAAEWNRIGLARLGGRHTELTLKVICSLAYWACWMLLVGSLRLRRKQLLRQDLLLLVAVAASGFSFVLIVGGNRYHLPLAPYVWVWLGSLTLAPVTSHSERASM